MAEPKVAVTEEQNIKLLAINKAMKEINKVFGAGSVLWANSKPNQEVEVIPTGCLSLDLALGGGIPKGRIIEFFGTEGAGKTTLALTVTKAVQDAGDYAAYIDMEHALDFAYMQTIGIDLNTLILSQPNSAEEALDILQELVQTGAVSSIIVDSVAALVPQKEQEGGTGDATMGVVARFMSKSLRKAGPIVGKHNAAVIFINQFREKIGISFGSPEVTTGGRALAYASSLRLELRRGQEIKDGDDVLGITTKVNVKKNKVFPPGKRVEFPLIYGTGIDFFTDMLSVAVDKGIIVRAGAWYTFGTERFQGFENVKEYLQENEVAKKQVIDAVYATLK